VLRLWFSNPLLPFFLRERCCCALFSLLAYFLVYRLFLNFLPSEVIAKSLIPKSIPTALLLFGNCWISCSVKMQTKYLPVGVRDMVILLIFPSTSRCSFTLIPPLNFGMLMRSPLIFPDCGTVKVFLCLFDLKRG